MAERTKKISLVCDSDKKKQTRELQKVISQGKISLKTLADTELDFDKNDFNILVGSEQCKTNVDAEKIVSYDLTEDIKVEFNGGKIKKSADKNLQKFILVLFGDEKREEVFPQVFDQISEERIVSFSGEKISENDSGVMKIMEIIHTSSGRDSPTAGTRHPEKKKVCVLQ